jgi:PIN domain nuclease of toxin-antitoxin system
VNILLDTHAFLWFVADNPRLSKAARVLIEAEDSQPFLSMASLWEIAIKISLGKLELEHFATIANLPFHHRDPFDRLIAVQSKIEKMPLVSADTSFDVYEIERVW